MTSARFRRYVACFVLTAALLPASLANAWELGMAKPNSPSPVVVQDDRGGYILNRAHEIDALRRSGREVRIVGTVCLSACTMLLGLPHACVSPRTVFGFHGPSRRGQRLDQAQFERASQFIALHYPPSLGRWYIDTGRHRINGLYEIAGSDLIAMGVTRCA